jgi:hypothetical protein
LGYINKSLSDPDTSYQSLVIQNAFPLHAAMVRKRVVEQIGGFDESLQAVEDWDLWCRLAHEHRFAYLDAILAKYRIVQGSISHQNSRKNKAFRQLKHKIKDSEKFASLPIAIRADFYFHWGVQELNFGEPEQAKSKFRIAIALDPMHLLARSALFLTIILGKKAVVFYQLKRWLLGPRGGKREKYKKVIS